MYIVVVIFYLFDWFSLFGWFKLVWKEKEEIVFNLFSVMWFLWGVLLNSGIGEG